MNLRFTKMHGLGNDFMVVDLVRQQLESPTGLSTELIRSLADRKTGIGFDQFLIVEPARTPEADFSYRIYNADGSEVEHCGNGARCVARFVAEQNLSSKAELVFDMANGQIRTTLSANGLVSVDMEAPILKPALIPFNRQVQNAVYPLVIGNTEYEISAISMGNPHAVMLVDNVDTAPVTELGPLIESHVDFPNKVNAGFMEVVNNSTIRLRVFERGAGETLACGTGACAAVVAGRLRGLLDSRVDVQTRGGIMTIAWEGNDSSVFMTGPTATVFDGTVTI